MEKESSEEIKRRLAQIRQDLHKEKAELESLAEECIKMGRILARDEGVLRQNRVVDGLVIEEHQLREMLKNYDKYFKEPK